MSYSRPPANACPPDERSGRYAADALAETDTDLPPVPTPPANVDDRATAMLEACIGMAGIIGAVLVVGTILAHAAGWVRS